MHYYRFANKISSYTLRYRLPEWTFLAIQKGQNINIFKKHIQYQPQLYGLLKHDY